MNPDPTLAEIMDPDPDPTLAKILDPDYYLGQKCGSGSDLGKNYGSGSDLDQNYGSGSDQKIRIRIRPKNALKLTKITKFSIFFSKN